MRTDASQPKLKDLKSLIAKNNCKKLIDFAAAFKGEIAYTSIDTYERVFKWTVKPEGNGGLPQEERLQIFEVLFVSAFSNNENFILRAASADEKSFRVFGFRARGESGNAYDIPTDLLESMVANREADAAQHYGRSQRYYCRRIQTYQGA